VAKEFFPEVRKINYEGPESDNPLAFRHYNPDAVIAGKTMKEHFRFSVTYWHTFMATGSDPFGAGTMQRPWDGIEEPMEEARAIVEAAFEFFSKLQAPYYCFHDRDIAPEGQTLAESNKMLDEIVSRAKVLQQETGVKLLWGTANCFSHPRYVHGASTSCDPNVFAYAAAQVKKAMEATLELGGENYVFWGGREGYSSLYNTRMKQELEQFARFLRMAADYKKEIGFEGQLLIEPKPKEPTTHQYDFDTATVIGFLRAHDLAGEFKINVEANHATLATHDFIHEITLAAEQDMLGSIDANRGNLLLGWDTDQFPTNLYETTFTMYVLLKAGGIAPGGLNFDAKVRRPSFKPIDLFHAHIGAMDAYALGLKIADRMLKDGLIEKHRDERYQKWNDSLGRSILTGKADFRSLEAHALSLDHIELESGGEELIENIINRYFGMGR
jgi:xylose isomerase